MLKKIIKSSQNPIVKELCLLRTSQKARLKRRQVLIMGKNMIEDLGRDFEFDLFITTKQGTVKPPRSKAFLEVPFEALKKISGLKNPEPYLAVLKLPCIPIKEYQRLLVLDQIADPGNLGTLLRTALAFSFDGVILTENSVDPFNDKVLRAAKGAHFYLPILQKTKKEVLSLSKDKRMSVFIADIGGNNLSSSTLKAPLMLVLGNEATGSSTWPKSCKKICIPIHPKVDSLNVGVCGGILMHLMSS